MDWKKLLTELLATGLTQKSLGDEVGLTQGAISQVLTDKTGKRGFSWEAGNKLVHLHRARVLEASQDAA